MAKPVSMFGGEVHIVDTTNWVPACGKDVPWGPVEKAQNYGYRCTLDTDHAGDCRRNRKPEEIEIKKG